MPVQRRSLSDITLLTAILRGPLHGLIVGSGKSYHKIT